MDISRLTSFASLTTGEGSRLAYTYSVVDNTTGEVKSSNNKGSFVVMDETLEAHVEAIRQYISQNKLAGGSASLEERVAALENTAVSNV